MSTYLCLYIYISAYIDIYVCDESLHMKKQIACAHCRGKKRSPGLLDTWAPGRLDTWTPGHLDTWTHGLLDTWALGHLDTWTPGHLDSWTPGHLDGWTPGLRSKTGLPAGTCRRRKRNHCHTAVACAGKKVVQKRVRFLTPLSHVK